MQKFATRIFVYASLAFGVIGITAVLAAPVKDNEATDFNILLMKLLFITGFIVLSSFAVSVAVKYLGHKS